MDEQPYAPLPSKATSQDILGRVQVVLNRWVPFSVTVQGQVYTIIKVITTPNGDLQWCVQDPDTPTFLKTLSDLIQELQGTAYNQKKVTRRLTLA